MIPSVPDWLSSHGGKLRPGIDGRSVAVMLDGRPEYALTVVPAGGAHGCDVAQTVNGARLGDAGVHPSPSAALAAGLEVLRRSLGW